MASSIPLVAPKDVDPAVQAEWYKIRDMFCGRNFIATDIPLALERAAVCDHPDARWLHKVCDGQNVKTHMNAARVFASLEENDARALCFKSLFCVRDSNLIRRSAELGFAFAQALMYLEANGKERLKFVERAAAQGERDGFYRLGCCFAFAIGCKKNPEQSNAYMLRASKLGCVYAMRLYTTSLDATDPQRWHWLGQVTARGDWLTSFLNEFPRQVYLFNRFHRNGPVMFMIGKQLNGQVNETKRTMFVGDHLEFDRCICPAKQAIAFYEAQIKATKYAMHAWTQVGIRWRVVKDIRKVIVKLIWDAREEALYDASKQSNVSARGVRAYKRGRK